MAPLRKPLTKPIIVIPLRTAERLMHGKTSLVFHAMARSTGDPSPFEATRYHSLVVQRGSVPSCSEVTAAHRRR